MPHINNTKGFDRTYFSLIKKKIFITPLKALL